MNIPIDRLVLPEFQQAGVVLDLLRLDLIHPQVSGNKWFKLKYALADVVRSECPCVLSFGGAWSNHIHALAWAAREQGIEAIGVIRGERPVDLSETLKDAERWGMRLHFVSRGQYRNKADELFLDELRGLFGDFHLLPEGGSGPRVIDGCREIYQAFDAGAYDYLCSACGTGGTLAGLIAGKPEGLKVIGVSALKGAEFLYRDIRQMLSRADVKDPGGWQIQLNDHEGGYARISQELALAMDHFYRYSGIGLEPVYTGKVYLSLRRMLDAGELPRGARVLMVHSGGMQGLRGMRAALQKHLTGR